MLESEASISNKEQLRKNQRTIKMNVIDAEEEDNNDT